MEIKDKVVIITGASSGIGEATAKLFAKKGAKVVLASRSRKKLEILSRKLPNSFVIQTNMTKENEIKEMVKKTLGRFGRIDILINNAGQGYDSPVELININTFHKIFDLDVLGTVIAMQQVIPLMRKQGKGVIVNISSGTALMILPGMSAYAGLKQALAKISLTAREELKKDNISVSVVYPYITETDFEKNTIRESKRKNWDRGGDSGYRPPPADPPEFVAGKILEAVESEAAEIVVHDWMKNRG